MIFKGMSKAPKQLFYFVCLIALVASCKNKKYDPETYKVESTGEKSSSDSLSYLRNECLTFINYCDQNKTPDIKLFARDWLRTWDGWKTEGVNEYKGVYSCYINTKSRFGYSVKSINVAFYTDSVPPVFKAERFFFSTEYKDLVTMVSSMYGTPDEEKEGRDGTIYKWHISDTKTISTIPSNYSSDFQIEYRLDDTDMKE